VDCTGNLFNASHVSLVFERDIFVETLIHPAYSCFNNTQHALQNNTPRSFIEANSSLILSKLAFSASFLLHSSKFDHTICPNSLRLGGLKGSVLYN